MTLTPELMLPVFSVGDRSWSVDDVIVAAHFRGELDGWWKEVLRWDACESRGTDPGGADEAALQSAIEQFRYERDLITAEETERWLEARGLTLDDFSDYFVRHSRGQRPAGEGPAIPPAFSEPTARQRDLLRIELLLSGGMEAMAVGLSWRLAALDGNGTGISSELIEAERARFFQRTGLGARDVAHWAASTQRDQSWLEEMLACEAAYQLEAGRVLTDEQRERLLHELRIPLTRVEVEVLEVESLAAAREATLCVREDGACLEEMARQGGYPHRREEVLIENFPPELQQRILCAALGEVLEPIPQGDGFCLWRTMAKTEPELDDAGIRARVERQLLELHFSDLAARCVRWQPGFAPP
jgi:hypothetical protein